MERYDYAQPKPTLLDILYGRQRQQQVDRLNAQLAALKLPMKNPDAFLPSAVQTLMQPNAPAVDWLHYGMGPEQQFFQPYYMGIPGQLGQAQDLKGKIDKAQKGGLLGIL